MAIHYDASNANLEFVRSWVAPLRDRVQSAEVQDAIGRTDYWEIGNAWRIIRQILEEEELNQAKRRIWRVNSVGSRVLNPGSGFVSPHCRVWCVLTKGTIEETMFDVVATKQDAATVCLLWFANRSSGVNPVIPTYTHGLPTPKVLKHTSGDRFVMVNESERTRVQIGPNGNLQLPQDPAAFRCSVAFHPSSAFRRRPEVRA